MTKERIAELHELLMLGEATPEDISEIVAALKDGERLEQVQKWMESGSARMPTYDPITMQPDCEWAWHTEYSGDPHDSFRAAIDAAMQSDAGQGRG